MACKGNGLAGTKKILIFLFFPLVGVLLAILPNHAQAEGNEPTITPVPTATFTLAPTDTPTATEAPLEAKSITQPEVSFDENAAPLSPGNTESEPKSLTDSMGGANLCLIGAIVVGTIVVMVMVVFGVIQRIRVDG